jgi:hypothetical protein
MHGGGTPAQRSRQRVPSLGQDRLLARHELRRILRDRRAPHAARSAARALDEMAARERLNETGRAFRETLALLEAVPVEQRIKLLRWILMKDGLEHAPAVNDATWMPDPD